MARDETKKARDAKTSDGALNESRLLGLINRTLKDRAEAEDVLQDAYEEYLASLNVGVAIESAGAWLARVAQNKVLDRFRRKKTRDDYAQTTREAAGDAEWAEAGGTAPDAELERLFLRAELVDAIQALPDEQREVFIWQELEGKTFEQISRETGVNINTLLARKRYALQFLREYLKEMYDELD